MSVELSDRQVQILQLRAEGYSGPQIARTVGIAVGTVDWHERVIVARLGARNIANAVLLGCQAGILDGRPRRHGDHAGYEAHRRRGEDPTKCERCHTAERDYRNTQRQAHRQNQEAA
ncbi:helix-turn-helix domain-containing protein [Streptomyces sp. NPDC004779]